MPDHVFYPDNTSNSCMKRREEESTPRDVTIIRKRVRTARLQVQPDGTLRVVAPPSFDVKGFLERNAEWIERRQDELDRLAAEGCGREDLLLLHGRFHRLLRGARFAIDVPGETVTCPSILSLRQNLSLLLREEIAERVETHPDPLCRKVGRITVKMQRTRWGSCSTLNNLNFNLRVIALPKSLREYIVIHEVAHLREQNHSQGFWRLVADRCPDYLEAEAELRRYWVILERNRVWRRLQDTR